MAQMALQAHHPVLSSVSFKHLSLRWARHRTEPKCLPEPQEQVQPELAEPWLRCASDPRTQRTARDSLNMWYMWTIVDGLF